MLAGGLLLRKQSSPKELQKNTSSSVKENEKKTSAQSSLPGTNSSSEKLSGSDQAKDGKSRSDETNQNIGSDGTCKTMSKFGERHLLVRADETGRASSSRADKSSQLSKYLEAASSDISSVKPKLPSDGSEGKKREVQANVANSKDPAMVSPLAD